MNNSFSNPQAPSNYVHPQKNDSGPLTNEDFRKLLMTPSAHTVRSQIAPQTVRGDAQSLSKKKLTNEAAEKRKEKKLFYAALVKESKEKEEELAQKYRDRAKERRTKEKTEEESDLTDVTQTGYRAVAPGFNLTDNAERRRQIIEESKYLGGDLEHTHLVKGLDYALLQKIRSQQDNLETKDEENEEEESAVDRKNLEQEVNEEARSDEDDLESTEEKIKANLKPKILPKAKTATLAAALNKSLTDAPFAFKKLLDTGKGAQLQKQKKIAHEESEDLVADDGKIVFKTKLGRNVHRVLFENTIAKSNDLFLPNRMAYIVDLNDEETDVPITSIRSKADCPNNEANAILTTNDIVINKLTQILSYLRHGKRDAKKLKKKIVKTDETETKKSVPSADLGIYDDIGDYVADLTKKSVNKTESKEIKSKKYFGEKEEKEDVVIQGPTKEAANEFIKNINEKYATKELEPEKKEEKKSGMSIKFDPDSYAECYPGTNAEEDVNIDSDEEADFSKMDMGNKKGPVNRWDFDTNEEFGNYMSNREALPKAAFQFGVKMNEGRKTRRGQGDQKEKAKLDKEWTKISKIIEKRKGGESSGDFKKPKY